MVLRCNIYILLVVAGAKIFSCRSLCFGVGCCGCWFFDEFGYCFAVCLKDGHSEFIPEFVSLVVSSDTTQIGFIITVRTIVVGLGTL